MSTDDDWSSVEDALLRRLVREQASWAEIADTLLRSITEVQARAVALDRQDRAAAVFAIPEPDDEPDDEPDAAADAYRDSMKKARETYPRRVNPRRTDEERRANAHEYATTGPGRLPTSAERDAKRQELAEFIAEGTDRTVADVRAQIDAANEHPVAAPTQGPGKGGNGTGRTWKVKHTGICVICGKGIEWDDGPRRRYCSPEHMEEGNRRRAADRYRQQRDAEEQRRITAAVAVKEAEPQPTPTPDDAYVHAKPPKPRPKLRNGGCNARHGEHPCVMRTRHRGEHLTDNGIIFSRDGKDVWRDVGDTYLMMALNNDMVAPQP